MADPTDLSIAEAREALLRKELSAEELARAHIDAIGRANEALNAFVMTTPERALEAGKIMQEALGEVRNALIEADVGAETAEALTAAVDKGR